MNLARNHIPVVAKLLSNDARFDHIRFDEYTEHNGSLLVHGGVRSDSDLEELRKIVASTSPPVTIHWRVEIASVEDLDFDYPSNIASTTRGN